MYLPNPPSLFFGLTVNLGAVLFTVSELECHLPNNTASLAESGFCMH